MRVSPEKIRSLTPRERTCLLAAAEGATAKEIALSLGIGYRTVQNYQQEAARKLGVTGTIRAARILIEAEQPHPVDVHPASAAVADPSISAAPTETHIVEVPPLLAEQANTELVVITDKPQITQNTSPIAGAAEAVEEGAGPGRAVRLTPERVLWLVLAWAVGFSAVLALVAQLYRNVG